MRLSGLAQPLPPLLPAPRCARSERESDERLSLSERFSIDELHRVEVIVSACSKVKHRSDVRMAHTSCSTSFPYKAPACRFITDELGINHLQCHSAPKVHVGCFVSHPHRAAAQLDRRPIVEAEDLVVLELQLGSQRSWVNGRPADRWPIVESTAQRTNRAGVAVIREQCTADRTDLFAFRTHASSAALEFSRFGVHWLAKKSLFKAYLSEPR